MPFRKKNKKKKVYGQNRRKEPTSQQERTRAILFGTAAAASPFVFPKAPQKIMKGVENIIKKF